MSGLVVNIPTQPGSALQYQGKTRSGKSITFDAIQQTQFGAAHDIAASQADTTIVDVFVLAQAAKVVRVGVTCAAVSGTPHIQLCDSPSGSETDGLLPIDGGGFGVVVTANNYAGQTIPCTAPDKIFPSGTVLTLRAQTGAGDTITGMHMTMELACRDEHPEQPLLHALTTSDY